MPRRAPLVCTTPGCPHAQPCPVHPSKRWSDGASGYTQPPGWQATRRRILNRDNHTCTQCGAPATQVDHITPISLGGTESDPMQSLCATCHTAKTQAEAHAARWPNQ